MIGDIQSKFLLNNMAKNRDYGEIFCNHCGEKIKEEAEICPSCGVRNDQTIPTESVIQYCRSCGEEIQSEAEVCPSCGVRNGSKGMTPSNLDSSSFSLQIDTDVVRILSSIFGGLFILSGVGTIAGGGGITTSLLPGLVVVILGFLLIPRFRENLKKEYPITDSGYVSNVKESIVENTNTPCVACQNPVDIGVERTYKKEFVLLGVPIFVSDQGKNIYCKPCSKGGISDKVTDQEKQTN